MRFLMMWILIIMVLVFFGVGKALYEEDNTIDVYNYTSKVNWNSTLFNEQYKNFTLDMKNSEVTINRVTNIVYKGLDTMGYIAFEVAKWGIEVGFRKPEWDYLWLAKWLGILLLLLVLSSLISVLPICIAIIYLLCVGVSRLCKRIFRKKKTKPNRKTTLRYS